MIQSKDTARALFRMVRELEEQELEPGDEFGDYEIVKLLGQGGIGIVYLARHAGVHPLVALKVIREGAASVRFRNGANTAALLNHPNIVNVYHVGVHEGRAFYTMRYVSDDSLENVIPEIRESPTLVAGLLAKVARAVHYAHESQVLHRDLKPSNILILREGTELEPFVADFDLAKRLNPTGIVQTPSVIGTPDYMAPEQVRGTDLSRATDIYALGVILYQILAHQVPFSTVPVAEKLTAILRDSPRFPSSLRAVDPDLEAICLRCLNKEPKERYQTAEELAEELERVAERGRIRAPRVTLTARARAWLRWHRGVAFILLALLMLSATCGVAWLDHRRAQREALAALGSVASGQAGAILFQLHQQGQRAHELASDPALTAILNEPKPDMSSVRLGARARPFDTLFIMRLDGAIWAQWPEPPPQLRGRDFRFRDYFKGGSALALSGRRTSYLARALSSESTGLMSFGFAAPVDAPGGPPAILVGLHTVGSTFDAANPETDTHHRKAILGPRDRDRDGRVFPDFTFLVHPLLKPGRAIALSSDISVSLRREFGPAAAPGEQFEMIYIPPRLIADYDDPVDTDHERWLAAFAPIGKTGYVVAMQAPQAMLGWTLPVTLGLALSALAWALASRRSR